uniref:peptide-methionine (S)-S-oxide reductase n=1 Tax=Staphylococcus sp. MRCNS378 TaxID=235409 RepID=Q6X966_9STAP|nr:unknown [Staphylococcus sp. MRCNS378]
MAYATLAGGCFWCMVKPFTSYPGIKSVVSGYSGGHVENPTYEQVCTNQTGHVEAVQIEYDSNITTFENILDVYFKHLTQLMTEGSSLIEVKAINLSFFIMMRINLKLPS